MENLELRKSVAIALGCKPYTSVANLICCECEGYSHAFNIGSSASIPFYELDHHAALDALIEFCEKRDWVWEISNRNRRFEAWIYGTHLFLEANKKSLPIAICEVINKASQSEKKEAGADV